MLIQLCFKEFEYTSISYSFEMDLNNSIGK